VEDGPGWSDIAGWYDDLVTAGSGAHETALRSLLGVLPDLTGRAVLDLACGQGIVSRALAKAGVSRVVGVDSSEAMLDRARTHDVPAVVTYALDDAQVLGTQPDEAFDGVTCQLALMDIPDLDATLAAVRRVLRPGGWFAFVIGHPCTLVPDAVRTQLPDGRPAMTVAGYFDERFWRSANPNGVRRAGNHHRTLSTYLNALVRAGFRLDAVDEPRPSPLLATQQPAYAQVPMLFTALASAVDITA
jgi:ubiquinone/menaquinone biosynthesis C-methylase UbiE